MPSPSCLSSIEFVYLTDMIEVEVADPLEREAIDEPDVGWQNSDWYFVDNSICPFGDDDNGEGIGEIISEDWDGSQ
jgi:hypothetical protein